MEEYIKSELIGGMSPKYLDTLSNLFMLLSTAHNNTVCIVTIGDWTHCTPRCP